MRHLTGMQARSLLEGATVGPWWVTRETQSRGGNIVQKVRKVCPPGTNLGLAVVDDLDPNMDTSDADLELMAAAPDLAATVSWLYDRPAVDPDDLDRAVPCSNGTVLVPGHGRLTPDETVDLARRLLTASEQARRAPEVDSD